MARRDDLEMAHGATTKARENAVKQDHVQATNAIKSSGKAWVSAPDGIYRRDRAHYARNTGIVVGYDTEALSTLGFELRPVVYSELAPVYQPQTGDAIRLNFVNREDM